MIGSPRCVGRDDGGVPFLGHRKEMVGRARGLQRVDRDAHIAVGAVLEADCARQPGGELAMDLRFRGACADRAQLTRSA